VRPERGERSKEEQIRALRERRREVESEGLSVPPREEVDESEYTHWFEMYQKMTEPYPDYPKLEYIVSSLRDPSTWADNPARARALLDVIDGIEDVPDDSAHAPPPGTHVH